MIDKNKLARIKLEKENKQLKIDKQEIMQRVNLTEQMLINLAFKNTKNNLK